MSCCDGPVVRSGGAARHLPTWSAAVRIHDSGCGYGHRVLHHPTRVSRRGLLTGGLGGLAVLATGCDAVDDVLGGEGDPGATGAVTPTAPAADADSVLVEGLAAAIAATGALAAGAGAAVPALSRVGRRLSRLHEIHASELGWSGTTERPRVKGGRAAVLRRLQNAEARLQDQLADAALEAESGALAQVLASMAAAVAQQRAVLS